MTDICVFEKEVVGGTAANHLLLPFNFLNTCHSERSEESHTLSRAVNKKISQKANSLTKVYKLQLSQI